jgi:hypothetical protein
MEEIMAKRHELVEVEAILVHETHKDNEDEGAFLVNDGKVKVWVPKITCQKTPHSNGKPNWYLFEMPQDVAEEKGLV